MIDISKLKGVQLHAYLFLFIALIFPGLGYIYFSEEVLFLVLDILKLLFLSILYSFPLLLIGIMVVSSFPIFQKNRVKDSEEGIIILGSILAISIFYFGLAAWLIYPYKYSLLTEIIISAIILLIVAVYVSRRIK